MAHDSHGPSGPGAFFAGLMGLLVVIVVGVWIWFEAGLVPKTIHGTGDWGLVVGDNKYPPATSTTYTKTSVPAALSRPSGVECQGKDAVTQILEPGGKVNVMLFFDGSSHGITWLDPDPLTGAVKLCSGGDPSVCVTPETSNFQGDNRFVIITNTGTQPLDFKCSY